MRAQILIVLLLSVPALSGCLEDPPDPAEPNEQDIDETRLAGRVVDDTFEGVPGAILHVVQGELLIAEATTDEEGAYRFDGILLGRYVLEVLHECCIRHAEHLKIESADQRHDVQLEPISLPSPYAQDREWDGFIACGLVASYSVTNDCGDPNHDTDHDFQAGPGLRTLLVRVEWEASNALSSQNMNVRIERYPPTLGTYEYASTSGPSPLMVRINATGHDTHSFERIEDEPWHLGIKVRPAGLASVVYQQPFTVHYRMHYWKEAHEDAHLE